MAGRYRPSPVRRVGIPKPDGSEPELWVLTVTDRLIQQALLPVLLPPIDPTLSKHSHGFCCGRRAHDAVLAARRHVQEGFRVVWQGSDQLYWPPLCRWQATGVALRLRTCARILQSSEPCVGWYS
jgi:hypothetical protein